MTAEEILVVWFEESGPERWFKKDPAFDALIRQRFLETPASAHDGRYDAWRAEAGSTLALIIILDQFPRNLFRDDPEAFASDAKALTIVHGVLEQELDISAAVTDPNRQFFYTPLMHSETLADQRLCVQLMTTRMRDDRALEFAERHFAIIERFGRFPHRNDVLGRISTPEELAFLEEDGSRF